MWSEVQCPGRAYFISNWQMCKRVKFCNIFGMESDGCFGVINFPDACCFVLPFSWRVLFSCQEEDPEKKSEMKVDIQEGPPPSSGWSFGSKKHGEIL